MRCSGRAAISCAPAGDDVPAAITSWSPRRPATPRAFLAPLDAPLAHGAGRRSPTPASPWSALAWDEGDLADRAGRLRLPRPARRGAAHPRLPVGLERLPESRPRGEGPGAGHDRRRAGPGGGRALRRGAARHHPSRPRDRHGDHARRRDSCGSTAIRSASRSTSSDTPTGWPGSTRGWRALPGIALAGNSYRGVAVNNCAKEAKELGLAGAMRRREGLLNSLIERLAP